MPFSVYQELVLDALLGSVISLFGACPTKWSFFLLGLHKVLPLVNKCRY